MTVWMKLIKIYLTRCSITELMEIRKLITAHLREKGLEHAKLLDKFKDRD
jgi:hypothetical protein